jgi:hypothetical protein
MGVVVTAVGLILLIGAAAAFAGACVEYARCSWYTNSDLMGASFAFTSLWLIGSLLLSGGLVLAAGLGVGSALAGGAGAALVGKAVEWFVIEPALAKLFKGYRRDSAEPAAAPDRPRD